ncbi:hypothetical protein GQ54DRAFT_313649 [Martensiomyces pterosporus]|nr:hypothetical protein GQ54DRAFT_313649 [Martensiomyces pterosporus]
MSLSGVEETIALSRAMICAVRECESVPDDTAVGPCSPVGEDGFMYGSRDYSDQIVVALARCISAAPAVHVHALTEFVNACTDGIWVDDARKRVNVDPDAGGLGAWVRWIMGIRYAGCSLDGLARLSKPWATWLSKRSTANRIHCVGLIPYVANNRGMPTAYEEDLAKATTWSGLVEQTRGRRVIVDCPGEYSMIVRAISPPVWCGRDGYIVSALCQTVAQLREAVANDLTTSTGGMAIPRGACPAHVAAMLYHEGTTREGGYTILAGAGYGLYGCRAVGNPIDVELPRLVGKADCACSRDVVRVWDRVSDIRWLDEFTYVSPQRWLSQLAHHASAGTMHTATDLWVSMVCAWATVYASLR